MPTYVYDGVREREQDISKRKSHRLRRHSGSSKETERQASKQETYRTDRETGINRQEGERGVLQRCSSGAREREAKEKKIRNDIKQKREQGETNP